MQAVVTGYKHFVGKDGTPWYVYNVIKSFGDVGKALCVGMETAQFWSNKQFDVQPNDKVDLIFEPNSSGKAVLSDIIIKGKGGGENA